MTKHILVVLVLVAALFGVSVVGAQGVEQVLAAKVVGCKTAAGILPGNFVGTRVTIHYGAVGFSIGVIDTEGNFYFETVIAGGDVITATWEVPGRSGQTMSVYVNQGGCGSQGVFGPSYVGSQNTVPSGTLRTPTESINAANVSCTISSQSQATLYDQNYRTLGVVNGTLLIAGTEGTFVTAWFNTGDSQQFLLGVDCLNGGSFTLTPPFAAQSVSASSVQYTCTYSSAGNWDIHLNGVFQRKAYPNTNFSVTGHYGDVIQVYNESGHLVGSVKIGIDC